ALVAVIVLGTALALGAITSLWREAEAARAGEQKGRQEAERNAAERLVALARSHWSMNELERARLLLEECPDAYRGRSWQEVHRLCHAELRQLPLTDPVHWAQWTPDSRRLVASCTLARKIQVWDAEAGRLLLEFQ